jgi:hypothetical protein
MSRISNNIAYIHQYIVNSTDTYVFKLGRPNYYVFYNHILCEWDIEYDSYIERATIYLDEDSAFDLADKLNQRNKLSGY